MNRYTYKPPVSKQDLEKAYFVDGLTQTECAEKFNTTQKRIFTAMKHYGFKSRKAVKRDQYGHKNHAWKGNDASKYAFHRRLYSRFGKPKKCQVCGTDDPSKSYDYANLTGKYHVINDYKPMCRSCHWKYDKKILNIEHMRGRVKNAGE